MSWVAGFVAATPGGLGPRELLLQQALTPHYGARQAVVAVILLRVLWTVAELLCAGVVWWLPDGRQEAEARDSKQSLLARGASKG